MRTHDTIASLATIAVAAGLFGCQAPQRPNIVLITVESLRPDHVACYTGPLPTTPRIDELAGQALVFDNALAVTSWTLAAHASLFTGYYPTATGVLAPKDRLADGYLTLAERLGEIGYQTAAVVGGPYLRKYFNLNQGFEHYDDSPSTVSREAHSAVTSPEITVAATRFLDERKTDRPFFLFLYYWDPHYDYIPPQPYSTQFLTPGCSPADVTEYGRTTKVTRSSPPAEIAYVLSQYDGEVRWTDHHLGLLFDQLRARGLWDNTAIILTADHGEQFFEHGMKGHKNSLFREEVHVPLLVKLPGSSATGRDTRAASHVDILPTLLELAQGPPDPKLHGESLLGPADPTRTVFAELVTSFYSAPNGAGAREVTNKQWFAVQRQADYLLQLGGGRQLLFDNRIDPAQTRDLSAERAPVKAELATRLAAWHAEMTEAARDYEAADAAGLTPDQEDELRALGYLQ